MSQIGYPCPEALIRNVDSCPRGGIQLSFLVQPEGSKGQNSKGLENGLPPNLELILSEFLKFDQILGVRTELRLRNANFPQNFDFRRT